jgi:hypothetical protein
MPVEQQKWIAIQLIHRKRASRQRTRSRRAEKIRIGKL